MKIGEVATAAGVTVETVRYYERRGVLPTPSRRPSGYRRYEPEAVERLRLVRRLQGLGLTLDEIIDALEAHDGGSATCDTERWRLDTALERIDQRIAELRQVRREIVRVRRSCLDGDCVLRRPAGSQPEATAASSEG